MGVMVKNKVARFLWTTVYINSMHTNYVIRTRTNTQKETERFVQYGNITRQRDVNVEYHRKCSFPILKLPTLYLVKLFLSL